MKKFQKSVRKLNVMKIKDSIKNLTNDEEKINFIQYLLMYSYLFNQSLDVDEILNIEINEEMPKGKCNCDIF